MVEVGSREELETWLAGGPPHRAGSTVMLVRGDGPEVRLFLPNAVDAAKARPERVVVWARPAGLLDPRRAEEIFGEGEWGLAAALDGRGRTRACVSRDRISVEDAVFAFEEAEKTSKVENRDG
jgi:hypothetical protein